MVGQVFQHLGIFITNWTVSGWNGKHYSCIKHQSFSDRTRIACLAGLEIATWLDKGWLF